MTRRGFVSALVAAAAAAATAHVVIFGSVRAWYHRLAFPALDWAPPGPLNPQTLKTLLGTAEALIDSPLDTARYADLFRWRAENLPGHGALYDRFAAALNDATIRSRGCGFAECDRAARRGVFAAEFGRLTARNRVGRLLVAIRERDWVLFDQHIVRPITVLFARTDAWLIAGYAAWPGTPRGLDDYVRQASAGVEPRHRTAPWWWGE